MPQALLFLCLFKKPFRHILNLNDLGAERLKRLLSKYMQNKKPNLNDSEEWAIVRSMYFTKYDFNNEDLEPSERMARRESRFRNNNKSSR